VALLPGARHETKRWPEEHWLELHERLAGAGHPSLCFSLESERRELSRLAARVEREQSARWCTEPLARMAALLSRCAVAVSNDSGLMHLAAGRGLRVVAMFGSTAPELGFAPAGPDHAVLCRHEPCQPCTLHGRSSCPRGHFRCMRELRPREILDRLGMLAGIHA
jgi:ADP-heptose:LPS heptosyltransferase